MSDEDESGHKDEAASALRARRCALSRFAAAGAFMFASVSRTSARAADAAGAMPNCVVTPEQTEGPFFVDEHLMRADIRSDPATGTVRAGTPLALVLRVHSVAGSTCAPFAGAIVDLWHCDAEGRYSDVQERGVRAGGEKFLRGYQVADRDGAVRFTTIFPGWYPGRAVHIHFKVRSPAAASHGAEFTSQLYFDEAIVDRVFARAPYARAGRRTSNEDDGVFSDGGRQLLLTPRPADAGYAAEFDIGVRLG